MLPLCRNFAMSIFIPESPPVRTTKTIVPPLESGDRLSRAEFEIRYTAMPELKKAELVEGVVFVGSPVRSDVHGGPHAGIVTWLGTYQSMTPGTSINDNATSLIDPDNAFQPDASLAIEAASGGQSRVNGSTRPRYCAATWRRSSSGCRKAWRRRSIRRLPSG